jgi:hypothetical protein
MAFLETALYANWRGSDGMDGIYQGVEFGLCILLHEKASKHSEAQ